MMLRNQQGQVRSGWIIAAAFGAYFLAVAIVSMIFIIFAVMGLAGSYNFGADFLQAIMDLTFEWAWLLIIFQELIMIAIVLFAWKKIFKRPLWQMGLGFKGHGPELGFGLLFGAFSIALVFAASLLTGNIQVESWIPVFSPGIITYLLVFILVGFAEEMFCRGFVMSVLRRTRSKPVIFIVSSLLFSLLHILNPGYTLMPLINIALVGALFAYMFMRSGNIWMPIGYHITWNYLQSSVFGMSVSGIETDGLFRSEYVEANLINGAGFGPEGGLLVTVAILAGFLVVRWYYRDKTLDFFALDPAVFSDTGQAAV